MRLAETTEQTDSGGGGVEVSELVLVDRLPEARGRRVYRGGLEYGCSNTVCERSVDEITVEIRVIVGIVRKWRKKLTCDQ